MKKLFLTIGLVLAAGILFTAQSPSLDGRALVADPGVFPKGLFAKTVGYLPGDTISVTNPANAERVDILVIGSLDPSEGVAIMLSPEAAQALNIKKNSNNLVKLTKRNGTVDEVANGSAVIASGAPVAEEAAEEEKPLSQVIEEAIENGEPVEEAEQEAIAAAEEKTADQMFDAEDSAIEEQEEVAAAEEDAAEEAAVEGAVVVAETPEEENEEVAAVEEGGEETPAEDYPEYEAVEDELAGETPEEPEEEFVEADVKDDVPEEAVAEVVEDEGIEETPVPEAVEDEYEAIVLVPSESKSPESNLVEEPLIIEEEKEVAAATVPSASGVSYISGFDQLAYQKYYVQIAVYKSAENVDQIASRYADRYPITVVQQGSKSPVLVGPLTVDEYGVVLERFKSYGFKDAFVKVGSGSARSCDNER